METQNDYPQLKSNGCDILVKNRDELFSVNDTLFIEISRITSIIGQYERYDSTDLTTYGNYNSANTLLDITMKKLRKESMHGLIQKLQVDETTGTITLSKRENRGEVTTDYIITNSKLFGKGNLSISLLIELTYSDGFAIHNSIAKIYPIDFSKLVTGIPAYDIVVNGENKKKRLDNFMEFLFMREGVVGCWIKNVLLNTNVSPTFARVYDSYKTRGLPMTQESFHADFGRNQTKYEKVWTQNIFYSSKQYWRDIVSDTHFGYIEMEKMDNTLGDQMALVGNSHDNSFNLGTIFEILYSKLALTFYGNVYMADDHAENIMIKQSDIVRHYRITRRGYDYDFYVDNKYVIKYIDFERFSPVINRNLIIGQNDVWFGVSGYYNDYYKDYFSSENTKDTLVVEYIVSQLKSELRGTVDNFGELMNRCLPDKFKNGSLYDGRQIKTYYINLDIREDVLKENFLKKPSYDIINVDVPFVNKDILQNDGKMMLSASVSVLRTDIPIIAEPDTQIVGMANVADTFDSAGEKDATSTVIKGGYFLKYKKYSKKIEKIQKLTNRYK